MTEYLPSQAELEQILKNAQQGLGDNQSLAVDTEEWSAGGIVQRVFHTTRLSSMMIKTACDDDTSAVEVRSRQSSNDQTDHEVLTVRLFDVPDSNEASTTYSIWHNPTQYAKELQQSYTITKILPSLAEGDDQQAVTVSDAEEDFAEFVDQQARAITADDIALLGRIATTMLV